MQQQILLNCNYQRLAISACQLSSGLNFSTVLPPQKHGPIPGHVSGNNPPNMASVLGFCRRLIRRFRFTKAVDSARDKPIEPTVLVFSTDGLCDTDKSMGITGTLDSLSYKAVVLHAHFITEGQPAKLLEDNPTARAIWIIDHDIFLSKHKRVSRKVHKYVRNGGTAILGGRIPSNTGPEGVFDRWMASRPWHLRWRVGQHVRAPVILQNDATVDGADESWRSRLAVAYSPTALFLRDVADHDAWYRSARGFNTKSDTHVAEQVAVAFARVGKGWLGYTGDVDNGRETRSAILEMMKLL